MIQNFTYWLHIQLSENLESFITLSTELTKLHCFTHGYLAAEMLSKIVSTSQGSANAVSADIF